MVLRLPAGSVDASRIAPARMLSSFPAVLVWLLLNATYGYGCSRSARSVAEADRFRVISERAPDSRVAPADAGHSRPAPDQVDASPEPTHDAEPCTSSERQSGMALVPGGSFNMGSDNGGEEDEHPTHVVTIDSFWLDLTETTVRQYRECVEAGKCRTYRNEFGLAGAKFDEARFRQPDQPVSGVSWDDAKSYCEFRGKRLPREAEWERAARGSDQRTYPWGNDAPDLSRHGCFARALGTKKGTTCPVGSYPDGAGPYGHLDLAGNVWEWMSDLYDPFAYRRAGAPKGEPGTCEQILETQSWLRENKRQGFTGSNPIPTSCERVLRGGAFNYPVTGLRSSNRVHHPADWRLLMAGVRCAKDYAQAGRSDSHSNATPPCAQSTSEANTGH